MKVLKSTHLSWVQVKTFSQGAKSYGQQLPNTRKDEVISDVFDTLLQKLQREVEKSRDQPNFKFNHENDSPLEQNIFN